MRQSLAERKEELDRAVVGWLQPVFEHEDPVTGRRTPGFTPRDAAMIAAHYACPGCYAVFQIVRVSCPVCHLQFRDFHVESFPDLWVNHLRDREYGAPAETQPTIDQALGAVAADPDVDQVPLDKLRKKHRPKP